MANGIRRKDAVGMQELVSQYIREMKIASGINRSIPLYFGCQL